MRHSHRVVARSGSGNDPTEAYSAASLGHIDGVANVTVGSRIAKAKLGQVRMEALGRLVLEHLEPARHPALCRRRLQELLGMIE